MTRVGKHSGARIAPKKQRARPRRRLLVLAVGTLATLAAWGFLVWAAVNFGALARGGETPAWAFVGLATIGATACLFVTLILGNKTLVALRGEAADRPVVPGGRRAAR